MRRNVATPCGPGRRVRQVQCPSGANRERSRFRAEGIDRGEFSVSLLEVMANDLLPRLRVLLRREHHGVALVEIGTDLVRHLVVDRVANECVAEPEGVSTRCRAFRTDQLAPHEAQQQGPQRRTHRVRRECGDRRSFERLTLDRSAFECHTLWSR